MAEGWIKLSRHIQDHWLWKEGVFDIRSAWIDLLLLANHEDVKTYFNGRLITCKRGTVSRSMHSLSKRWGWSRKKVTKFIDVLENDKMVTTERTTEGTTITIVNYDKFQLSGTTNGTTNGTTQEPRRNTNNNVKNVKNVKNVIYGQNKFNQFEHQEYDMEAINRSLDL